MEGRVHSYITLSAVDGPGLRFVLFLQGCPLRCVYCHNPDTWSESGGTFMSAETVMNFVEESGGFYRESGGGITISGGEPLFQSGFSKEVLALVKSNGYHTALDTSGYRLFSEHLALIESTDYVILDIKALTEEKYRSITGEPHNYLIPNTRYVLDAGKSLMFRYVLLPGMNDRTSDIDSLLDFVIRYPELGRIQIQPYSRAGLYKWRNLSIKSQIEDMPEGSKIRAREIADMINLLYGKTICYV